MSEVTIDLIDRLVGKFPTLQPLLREHLAENFGEVLPHVFFGDLTRYVASEFLQGTDYGLLRALLDELEHAFGVGDERITEVIAVSFLQNLPRPGEEGESLRDLLGPALRSELERIV